MAPPAANSAFTGWTKTSPSQTEGKQGIVKAVGVVASRCDGEDLCRAGLRRALGQGK